MEISEVFLRILVATALGSAIGLEREYRDKSAGFRTMILISVGSALFTILAFNIASEIVDSDPTRIISYIISGIGFLGAGVIIKDGVHIKGLTTASTIWLTAGLGMGAGSGFFAISTIAASVILFALIVLPPIEHWIDSLHEFRHYEIEVKSNDVFAEVMHIFSDNHVSVFHAHRSKNDGAYKLIIDADGKPSAHHAVGDELVRNQKIVSF